MTAAARQQGDPTLAPYTALIDHAELELELAGRGEVDRLTELADRWHQLVAAVPPTPPPSVAPYLERAILIHERTRIELTRLREALLAEIATAERARRTARGYGAAPARPRVRASA